MASHNASPKQYNSVATLAFTVEHDELEDATDEEYLRGLLERIADLVTNNEWQLACDLTDTQQNVPDVSKHCNTCGDRLGTEECSYPTRKNERFLATIDEHGHLIAICCEQCQQELIDQTEESTN